MSLNWLPNAISLLRIALVAPISAMRSSEIALTQHIPVWLAAIVILRDVIIVTGAIAYNFIVGPVQGEPTRISKLNTALQLLFLLFVLSRAGFGWPDEIAITVLGASILVTVVISGIDYVWSWSRRAWNKE